MPSNLEKHAYFKMLDYAYKNEVFDLADVRKYSGVDYDLFRKWYPHIAQKVKAQDGTIKHSMTYSAFVTYMEIIELKEARASSKNALIMSIIAMTISALLAAFSIWINLYHPIELSQEQFSRVIEALGRNS